MAKLDPEILAHLEWIGFARPTGLVVSAPALVRAGAISYIPFPPALLGKYQSYTKADLARLRAAGYDAPTVPLDEGVRRYVEWLMARERG